MIGQTSRWLKPIIRDAQAGFVIPVWSPLIIAESNRLLTWLWIERHGGGLSDASWRQCSQAAKAMFDHQTRVFRVVEDSPPYQPLWTADPPDEWDVPIWTAAVRAKADFIVTENLADGPPPDEKGLQSYEGITFAHPEPFLAYVNWYADLVSSAHLPALHGEEDTLPAPPSLATPDPLPPLSPSFREFFSERPDADDPAH